MTKRLFLGVPVPEQVREALSFYMREYLTGHSIKIGPKENYHITVSFFGDVNEEKIPELNKMLNHVLKEHSEFVLRYKEIVLAPPKKQPRMIWATFEQTADFLDVVNHIEERVCEIIHFEDARKGHTPIPHVTLARFTDIHPKVIQTIPQMNMQVQEIILYESLQKESPRYVSLHTYNLVNI